MGRPKGSRNKSVLEAAALQVVREARFSIIDLKDPFQYLNERSLEYIKRLELIADEARENGNPELELKTVAYLARLSPVYKTKVDVSASQLGLLKAPDLSGKSDAELKALETVDIEGREIKPQ